VSEFVSVSRRVLRVCICVSVFVCVFCVCACVYVILCVSVLAMKLWARALLRSYVEEDLGIFWAFLPKEDFTKTNQSSSILPQLIKDMEHVARLPLINILLWQEPRGDDKVHALLYSKDETTLHTISQAFKTPLSDGRYVRLSGFVNFSEAELEIRKILKQDLI